MNEAVKQGAVVEVKVKFLASTVYHKKFNICDELAKLGQNCPLLPTNIFVNETYPIPKKGYPHISSIKNSARMPRGAPSTNLSPAVLLFHPVRQISGRPSHHLHRRKGQTVRKWLGGCFNAFTTSRWNPPVASRLGQRPRPIAWAGGQMMHDF